MNNWELPAAASSTTTTGTTANKGNRKNGGFLGNQKVAGEVRDVSCFLLSLLIFERGGQLCGFVGESCQTDG